MLPSLRFRRGRQEGGANGQIDATEITALTPNPPCPLFSSGKYGLHPPPTVLPSSVHIHRFRGSGLCFPLGFVLTQTTPTEALIGFVSSALCTHSRSSQYNRNPVSGPITSQHTLLLHRHRKQAAVPLWPARPGVVCFSRSRSRFMGLGGGRGRVCLLRRCLLFMRKGDEEGLKTASDWG